MPTVCPDCSGTLYFTQDNDVKSLQSHELMMNDVKLLVVDSVPFTSIEITFSHHAKITNFIIVNSHKIRSEADTRSSYPSLITIIIIVVDIVVLVITSFSVLHSFLLHCCCCAHWFL